MDFNINVGLTAATQTALESAINTLTVGDLKPVLASQMVILANQAKILAAIAALQEKETEDMSALSDRLASFQTDLDKAIADLKAAVAAGNPADVAAAIATLDSMDAEVIAADPGVTPTPAPPPPASFKR